MASSQDEAFYNFVSKHFSTAAQNLNNYGVGFQSNNWESSESNQSSYETGYSPFTNVTAYYGGHHHHHHPGGSATQAPPAHVGNLAPQPWHCPSLIMFSNNGPENYNHQPYGHHGNYYPGHRSGYSPPLPPYGYYPQLASSAAATTTNEFLSQPLNLSDSRSSLVQCFNPYVIGGGASAGPSALTLSEIRTSPISFANRQPYFDSRITEIENDSDNNDDETGSSDVSESETTQSTNSFLIKSRLSAFETVLPSTSVDKEFVTSSPPSQITDDNEEEFPPFTDMLTAPIMTSSLSGGHTKDAPLVRTPDSSEKVTRKRSRGRPRQSEQISQQPKGSFTKEQVRVLEVRFDAYPFLRNAAERKVLAEELNVTEHRITVWFQNRRTKERKKGVLPKGTLPSHYFK